MDAAGFATAIARTLADAFSRSPSLHPLLRAALFAVVSLLGALALGAVSWAVETATYRGYVFLERLGLIQRLIPEVDTSQSHYSIATFKTFVASTLPPLMLACYTWRELIAAAHPDWRPLVVVPTLWALEVVHDAWFYTVHMVLHRFKPLYRKIHAQHHAAESDLTVFDTANMHLLEAFGLTMSFYALLLAIYWWRGTWNPVTYTVFVLLEASMNMGGHCGYDLPAWLMFLVTMGIGNTPWSASSTTHYIHHLDPRVNRALYFTWCDQLAGTYRPTHPRVKQMTRSERRAYNWRPVTMLLKHLRAAKLL